MLLRPTSLLFLLGLVFIADAAKVVVFFTPLSNSQVVFHTRLAEELAKEHDVTLVVPQINPSLTVSKPRSPKVKIIQHVGCAPELFNAFYEAEHPWVYGSPPALDAIAMSAKFKVMLADSCNNTINNQKLLDQLRTEKFDFAFTSYLDYCAVGVIRHLEIPQWAIVMSTPPFRPMLHRVGIPSLPSIFPAFLSDYSNHMTFGERMKNLASELFFQWYYKSGAHGGHAVMMKKAWGEDFPHLSDLVDTGSMLVMNSHPDIEYPLPVTSKVVYLGGLGLDEDRNALNEPFKSFVENASKVVLVSFGTVAPAEKMPHSWKAAFEELFRKNPSISFVWKMDGSDAPAISKNVLRSKWIPQYDLLGNENVVAFITHGGYNSIGEAIASGTPLVTIPLFGDQFRNAHLVKHRNCGVRVEKTNVTAEALQNALKEVLENKKYTLAAKELQSIYISSPLTPGQKLRGALNFTLAHPNYNRNLPTLPLYALYSIDCIVVLSLSVLVVLWLFWRLLKCYYWSCCKMAYKEKEKIQ